MCAASVRPASAQLACGQTHPGGHASTHIPLPASGVVSFSRILSIAARRSRKKSLSSLSLAPCRACQASVYCLFSSLTCSRMSWGLHPAICRRQNKRSQQCSSAPSALPLSARAEKPPTVPRPARMASVELSGSTTARRARKLAPFQIDPSQCRISLEQFEAAWENHSFLSVASTWWQAGWVVGWQPQ